MKSIARSTHFSLAHLTVILRNAVVTATSRRAALPSYQVALSSRTFGSTTVSSATSSSSSSVQGSVEIEDKKPKRKRRTREEIEAAKLAKAAFGVPIRSHRRTRRALSGTTVAQAEENPEQRAGKASSKDLIPEGQVNQKSRSVRLPVSEEGAAEQPLSAETMEELLLHMTYDHLPPRNEWKEEFPISKQHLTSYRYFVSNRSTIQDIISHLGITAPERNGEKVTVVEGYSGPGLFASELLKMPQVEKVIALEATPCYLKRIELLKEKLDEKQPGAGARLDTLTKSAYLWDTYSHLVSSGKLAHLNNRVLTSDGRTVDFTTNEFVTGAHSDASWQKLSPVIFFTQLPNTVYGEQLFAQIVTAIATRSWLFRHGRIQLGFVCGESLAKRCVAEAGDRMFRGKLGTTVQCLADVQVHRYADDLSPHTHHFFPPTMSVGPRVTVAGSSIIPNSNPSTGLTRTGMAMMTVTPKAMPLVKPMEIEAFEFIARNLFILRTKPVAAALTHVAPGGQNVLKMTSPQQVEKGLIREDEVILPEEVVSDLTNVQWACLARMFEKWPFRPRHLFEEGRIKPDNKRRN